MNTCSPKTDFTQPKPAKRGTGDMSIKDIDQLDVITKQFEKVIHYVI